MRYLVTGGAGFMGSHLIQHLLSTTNAEIVSLDRLDTSGNLNRLVDLECWESEKKRVKVIFHDLRAPISEQLTHQIGTVDVILHMAASTSVDRSIQDPVTTIQDNILGSMNILEFARKCENLQWFYYQSTDEVFGFADPGVYYHEWDRYRSSNPYSASKAGAEELCVAYHRTYDVPVLICHTMNLYAERQHKEKYCPSTISKILNGEEVQVHAYPDLKRAGSRFYLHCRNLADGISFLLQHGETGEKYNICGSREVDNLSLAQQIADIIGKPLKYRMVDAHSQRRGHDPRYALSMEKITGMGWKPPISFDESLEQTVRWYLHNQHWL